MPTYNGQFAAVYGRVSTDDQQNSVDAQRAQVLAYAKFKRLTVLDDMMFCDEDTSGSKPIADRVHGARLIESFRNGKAQHLIIPKLDRLGRNAVDVQQTYLYLTRDLGVTIHCLDLGGSDFSSDAPFGKFIVGLMSLCAEWEVERIRARIRDVQDHKFKNNEQIGTVPFGWKAIGTGREGKTGREIMQLHADETEIIWLRQIIDWRIKQAWSYVKIANELNRCSVPTKRGGVCKWTQATVFNLFKNRQVRRFIQEQQQPQNENTKAA